MSETRGILAHGAHEPYWRLDRAEIAAFLNQHFICIKVDREERPDVDDIYMTATQVLTGRGGWPLTVFMTPEGLPFLGGTYFPARQGDRGERIGFLELITRIASLWKEKPEPLLEQAERLTAAVQQVLREQRKLLLHVDRGRHAGCDRGHRRAEAG